MVITRLEQKDKRRIFLYADDTYFATVDPKICEQLGLFKGMELDEAKLEEVLLLAQVRKARERALYLLDRRPYSRKELFLKVKTTNDPKATDLALDELEQVGLINDVLYARQLAEEYTIFKGLGKTAIIAKLRQKGLDKQTVDAALEEFVFNEAQTATQMILKKYAGRLGDPKGKQQVMAALLRRGYNYSQAKQALAMALEQLEEEGAEMI